MMIEQLNNCVDECGHKEGQQCSLSDIIHLLFYTQQKCPHLSNEKVLVMIYITLFYYQLHT